MTVIRNLKELIYNFIVHVSCKQDYKIFIESICVNLYSVILLLLLR